MHNTENIKSFERLFKECYSKLYKISFLVTHDKQASQDIIQELFLKVWTDKNEFLELENYLSTSVFNRSLNYIRDNAKIVSLHNRKGDMDTIFITKEIQNNFDYELLKDAITKSVDKLPPQCKLIFLMNRMEGLKNREISERLGLSVKTIEKQLCIALHKIKGNFNPIIKEEYKEYILSVLLILITVA